MAKIGIIYDYFEDKQVPMKMAVQFKAGEIDWSRSCMYIPLEAPFERFDVYYMDSELLAVSVHLDDLLINLDKPGSFGINLHSVGERAGELRGSVRLLYIQMADVEDILQMDIRQHYDWG